MKKIVMAATVIAAGMALAAPAKAEHLLLQMLGESELLPNGLDDANDIAGTDVSEDDIEAQLQTDLGAFIGCFAVPLLDPATKVELGTGIDCLYTDLVETAVVLAVSFFEMPGGSLVNAGRTSLGGFTAGFGDGPVDGVDGPPVTHMTGSVPGPHEVAENRSIIAGTGQFDGVVGTARVSGAVALLEPIWFNCLWDLDLWMTPGTDNAAKRSGNRRK